MGSPCKTPSLFQGGIRFQDGTLQTTGAVAIIQAAQQSVLQTSNPPVISTMSVTAAMFQVSLFMESNGSALSGHTVVMTLQWTGQIATHTVTATLPLDAGEETVVLETFPIFSFAGNPVSVILAYGGGATNDPYAYSVRIVQMP